MRERLSGMQVSGGSLSLIIYAATFDRLGWFIIMPYECNVILIALELVPKCYHAQLLNAVGSVTCLKLAS